MKKISILFIVLLLGVAPVLLAQKNGKPNILFIAVDDLKPLLGCYGDTLAITPNIDALAAKGLSFTRSYCQQAVCAPSRASLMTSRYPDQTRIWDLNTMMRDMDPGIITLPQYLIEKGYSTSGTGKIFDSRSVDSGKDTPSWSVAFRNAWNANYYDEVAGKPSMYFYASQHAKDTIALLEAEAAELGLDKISYVKERYFPAFENANVPYDAYSDGAVANVGIELMEEAAASGKPFFLAVGFSRPHLPFNAPAEFWDMYRREDFSLAPFREHAVGSPSIAYHNSDELRTYTGIPKNGDLPEALQLELIHGYYAATSYIDHLVGMITSKLDELGLADNTIIVLWGDHGWHLGDHQLWCKHSNFEEATRAPLIIHYPGQPNQGALCHSPVELTDIAPTLLELAGIDIPGYFEGESLAGLIVDTLSRVREGSLSQYPRGNLMGYSLRTERFRYTRWTLADGSVSARELYDYQVDPYETVNRVFYPEHTDLVSRLDSIVVSRIATPSTQHKIKFVVSGKDSNGSFGPLEGAAVRLAGETRETPPTGELLFTHHEGEFTYLVEASGYKPLEASMSIKGDTVITLELDLEDPLYLLSVKLTDHYTKKALINAAVSLDDHEMRTDIEGEVFHHLVSGSYLITLHKDLYPMVEENLEIVENTNLHYRLKATHATVKIRLKEEATPVNNAAVTLGGMEVNTNSLGISVFENLTTGVNYDYLIVNEGYSNIQGSLVLNADTTVEIQAERISGTTGKKNFQDASLRPNPAGDRLLFDPGKEPVKGNVGIFDARGSLVREFQGSDKETELDLSHLPPGIYCLHWEISTGTRFLKLMKN